MPRVDGIGEGLVSTSIRRSTTAGLAKYSTVGVIGISMSGLTFDVRGRRSGEAAKGTRKRSLWAVPLDGMVRCDRFSEHLP